MTKKSETRRFGMHAKLLYDVILRQAGTVEKAVLEGVMNSVDAGAQNCVIKLTNEEIEISDDGKGIQTRDQIEKYFETFGQPHEENENKRYGTFRMGRGQLFAFGVNVWRTGEFRMEVDIKNRGLDYELESGQKLFPGCGVRVELYTKLVSSAVYEAVLILKRWCRYAPITVTLNGEVISIDPETESWDHILPEAFIRLNGNGELSLYNLGVYVCGLPNYRLGTGGEVVSRKQLKMNFARNEVQSDCPVWMKVKPFVDKQAERKTRERTRPLQSYERQRLASKLRQDWQRHMDLLDTKLCSSGNGRSFSLNDISPYGALFRRYGGKVTRCEAGSNLADRVMQHKLALAVSDETLKNFGFSTTERGLTEFLDWARAPLHIGRDSSWVVTPLTVFEKELGEEAVLIEEKKWTPRIRVWVKFAEYALRIVQDSPRAIKAGKFPGARAWTDGLTFIAFDDDFLRKLPYDLHGIAQMLEALFHEAAHDDDTHGTHNHGVEFYEHERELKERCFADALYRAPQQLVSAIGVVGSAMSRKARRLKDPADKIDIAAATLKEKCDKAGEPFVG